VHRRVRDGDWERLFPRVFLVGGHRLGDEARVRAAWLWAGGEPAAVTGPAAAYGHGMLERAPAVVDLTVPRGTHRRPQRGIRLRRRDLGFPDLVGIRDLWLADAPLAALETAVALRGTARCSWTAHCSGTSGSRRCTGRTAEPGPSRLVHGRAADHGRGGSGGLGRRAAAGPAAARGRGHRLGARPPVRRLPDRPGVPASRLAVEVDGWAWHVDAARFRADRRKGNAVTRAGWDLLRFTWHDLDSRPSETVSEIAQTLARAA
jgi:hypothetical protein